MKIFISSERLESFYEIFRKIIILIVTKNQDLILTLKDTFFEKTHEPGELTPLANLGLKVIRCFAQSVLKILSLYEAALLMKLRIAVNDFHQRKSRHSILRLLKLRT